MTDQVMVPREDDDPPPPQVTGSPDVIWLNYGDIERDCTHDECHRDGDVTWCNEQVFASDVKYVRAALEAKPQEPVGGWYQSEHGNYLELKWVSGYTAHVGDKLYAISSISTMPGASFSATSARGNGVSGEGRQAHGKADGD